MSNYRTEKRTASETGPEVSGADLLGVEVAERDAEYEEVGQRLRPVPEQQFRRRDRRGLAPVEPERAARCRPGRGRRGASAPQPQPQRAPARRQRAPARGAARHRLEAVARQQRAQLRRGRGHS
jgi:hypothetical protein